MLCNNNMWGEVDDMSRGGGSLEPQIVDTIMAITRWYNVVIMEIDMAELGMNVE